MSRSRFHRIVPALLRRSGLSRWLSYSHPLLLSGQRFSIPIKEGLGEELLKLEPDFKSQLIEFFGPSLPDTFVDIGANLGQTIVEAFSIRRWNSYLALEPSPEVCAYLQALVTLNHLPVQILPWAAGAEAAMHRLCAQGRADASATMAPEGRPGVYSPEMSQWVAAYPLDRLLEFVSLPRGLMIKIDVEGFEASVLDGASRVLDEVRPVIMCEVLRAYVESAVDFNAPADGQAGRDSGPASLPDFLHRCGRGRSEQNSRLAGNQGVPARPVEGQSDGVRLLFPSRRDADPRRQEFRGPALRVMHP